MAKNIKWIKVDSVTGVSEATTKATNGAVNPNLSGLVQQFDWGQYFYGTADGGAHIYYDNSLVIQTTGDGVSITGASSTISVAGVSTTTSATGTSTAGIS